MVICNACRYCEGFCAVFPAIERRRTFSGRDLIYFANLCHNCRGCYYACQYAPPHEFDLNVSKTLQTLRAETYRDFLWPGFFGKMFQRNGLKVSLITAVAVVIVLMLVALRGNSVLFSSHHGEGAFYAVIPYSLMVLPVLLIGFGVLGAIMVGIARFWRELGEKRRVLLSPRVLVRATADTLLLRYLAGGGHGCNYPDERFSQLRRWFHHLVFYGFMLAFAATTIAAFYENILHRIAPYPFWSLPVMLGTVGGVALLIGAGGMLWYRWHSDPSPANRGLFGMDLAFSMMLFLTSLTGLLLLVLRATSAMGILLSVHLGIVLGLFITMPYGKFVHAFYHYAALVKNAIEEMREEVKV
jgi:citrate/tricarballylate utilization protein